MSKRVGRLGRLIRAPIRALSRARDCYVSGMNSCAERVGYGEGLGHTVAIIPRSYSLSSQMSSSSSEDDLRELIRAASQGRAGSLNLRGAPRSQSVVVGRIDEDAPCEFNEDVMVGSNLLFPRSRSCAVPGKRRVSVLGRLQ